MISRVFSLSGATLIAAMELALMAQLPSQSEHTLFWPAIYVFAANYAVLLLYITVIHPEFVSPLRQIRGPKWSWVRMITHRLTSNTTQAELLLEMVRQGPDNGLLALRELSRRRLLITKPHVVAELMVQRASDFEKPENMRRFLRNIVGDGLLIAEGDRHRFMRKKINPAFSFRRIKDLYPMMWKNCLAFGDELAADIRAQGPPVQPGCAPEGTAELTHWANKTTLKIIGNSLLGKDLDVLGGSEEKLVRNYKTIFDPDKFMLMYFVLSAWISHWLANALPWKVGQVFQDTTASLKSICVQTVREKREAMKKGGEYVDILSQLIQIDVFSEEELADQLLTFLAAGHDTTALTLTWACYLLAVDPERQDALRKEVCGGLAAYTNLDADPSADENLAGTLEGLPLLNGVISETLRLYPTVPVSIRAAVRDTTLDGRPIPRGTEALVSPWVINRSRELWGEDADAFRPERWISPPPAAAEGADGPREQDPSVPRVGKPNYTGGGVGGNYNFITFLHGPRNCIGQTFARAELRCLLASIVSHFQWTLDMDVKDVIPGGAITIKPQNGLHLKMTVLE